MSVNPSAPETPVAGTPAKGARGRPRSAATHQAIVGAALALVGKVGFERLSVEAIAAYAGVSKASIYRRWPNKAAIVMDLLLETIRHLPTKLGDQDFRTVVKNRIRVMVRALRGPLGNALAGLIADAHSDPELERVFSRGFVRSRRREVGGLIEEAKERGELPADLDPELFMDLFYGAVFYRLLISRRPVSERYVDTLLDRLTGQ